MIEWFGLKVAEYINWLSQLSDKDFGIHILVIVMVIIGVIIITKEIIGIIRDW